MDRSLADYVATREPPSNGNRSKNNDRGHEKNTTKKRVQKKKTTKTAPVPKKPVASAAAAAAAAAVAAAAAQTLKDKQKQQKKKRKTAKDDEDEDEDEDEYDDISSHEDSSEKANLTDEQKHRKYGYRRKATLLRKLVEFETHHGREIVCLITKKKKKIMPGQNRAAVLAYASPGIDPMHLISLGSALGVFNTARCLKSQETKAKEHRHRPPYKKKARKEEQPSKKKKKA